MRTVLPTLLLLSSSLPAQLAISQYIDLAEPFREYNAMRPAGDVDLDGVEDFIAFESDSNDPSGGRVVSGATGNVVWSFDNILTDGPFDAVGIGDLDGDSRSDIVFVGALDVLIVSGLDGSTISSQTRTTTHLSVDRVGDFNGNGSPDYVVARYFGSGDTRLRIRDGSTDAILLTSPNLVDNGAETIVRSIDDQTGDGKDDLVAATYANVYVVRSDPPGIALTIPFSNSTALELLDLDGIPGNEILVATNSGNNGDGTVGRLRAYRGTDGLELFSATAPDVDFLRVGQSIATTGDLNDDGIDDFAVGSIDALDPFGEVVVMSGADQRILWRLPGNPQLTWLGFGITALGDVDSDGYGDLSIACGGRYSGTAGWMRVSGKILADTVDAGSACGGGPFLPELGTSRWVLGSNVTLVGRDGPAGAAGAVAFSARPPLPTFLGASSCHTAVQMGAWTPLFVTALPDWSVTMFLPYIPQLVGIEVALQTIYAPTAGPLGLDLSNGLWARIGY